ncbi:hypothetical protein BHYA_0409g00050 [Botrytis hyacinthi]|uniref:Uncharacterized protein n=1 Tax=Botrytis hyacinthi TaxID=278943 RepID=A0A4Z1GC46_9HELO|nr:hypothetical protein BHYA_0409g00050 [Botrytis hyacinthi]
MRRTTRILLTQQALFTPQLYHYTQHSHRLYIVTNASTGFESLPDHDQHLVKAIEQMVQEDSDCPAKCTGTVAYYTCYETCGPTRWNLFRQAFYKLLLKQWENEVREGVDPKNLRALWKVRSFQVEENTSMVALRRKFNDTPRATDLWVDDSYWVSGSASSTTSKFIPTLQIFLLIDADVVASVIEGPANREIPFLYVVDPCYGLFEDDEDDDDPEYKEYLKISVELFGEFWSNVSAGDIFDIEKLGPSDPVKKELFTSALTPEVWDRFKLEQIVSSVTGKLNNTSHHIQTIVGSHDIPAALLGLEEHIFNMKVLFHNPTIQNFVGKNAWRGLPQEERKEKLGEMMAVYEYMNHNAAILQQTYANISLELAAFESHTQTQGLVDWFRLFVDDMFTSMDQRTRKFVTTKITEMIDDLGEINTWEREMNKKELEAIRAEACSIMSNHWLFSPLGSWKPSRLMSLTQKE